MPPSLQQATADPCLCQRILETHRKVCFSHLWGHCSFLLSHDVHELLFVPSISLFPSPMFSSVQLLSCIWLFVTPWTVALQASLSITNSPSLLKIMSTELVMPSNCLILCYPLLLLPSIFPSIRVFSNESVLPIRWQKYWSFSFSISPSNKYSWLISFRIDWLHLLAVQGTLKSLLQHHSSKHQFFSTQLLYSPTLTSTLDY